MRQTAMYVLLVLSLLLIGLGVLRLAQPRDAAPRVVIATGASTVDVRRISVEELNARLQSSNPPLVWDFRTAESYAEGHVPNSRLVQLSEVSDLAQSLDRQQPIVTLCA
jgi:hypothetical protein